jgi:release factor glutamine methyltransferase
MRILRLPGVFEPRSDTWMLAAQLRRLPQVRGDVADVCTGSGALAIAAARAGARSVTAIDVSRRALLATGANALLNGARVCTRRGFLLAAVPGEAFDLIVSNPPYLPAADAELPERGSARHTEAGLDGRLLVDRLIAEAPRHLRPGGLLMLCHSSLNGEEATVAAMRGAGLSPIVLERRQGPLGPLLAGRAAALEARGLLSRGVREEEVLVIGGGLPNFAPVLRIELVVGGRGAGG